MDLKPECLIDKNKIPWIDPLSEESKTQLPSDVYKYYIDLLTELVSVFGKETDISSELNVLTILQLFIYYVSYNKITDVTKMIEILIACFLTVQSLFSDYSHWGKKYLIEDLIDFFTPEGDPRIYSVNRIQLNQRKILKFFDYTFQILPLTINYIIYIKSCLYIILRIVIYQMLLNM